MNESIRKERKLSYSRGTHHDPFHSQLCSSPFPLLCKLLDLLPYVGPHEPLPPLPRLSFGHLTQFGRLIFLNLIFGCLEVFQHIFAVIILSTITGIAFFMDCVHYRFTPTLIWNAFLCFFKRLKHYNLYDHVRGQGYGIQDYSTVTSDGYVLTMQRLTKTPGGEFGKKGAVLLQHGLLNTSLTWVLNARSRSLAFMLCDHGYDVFLGNNRGSKYSRKHQTLDPNSMEFWNYSIDDLVEDMEAMYSTILSQTPNPNAKIVFVGHSQGTTQAFAAFSTRSNLLKSTKFFIAMAPAAFVNPLESRWLIGISKLYQWHRSAFFTLVGLCGFMPVMEWPRPIIPPYIWAHLGQVMFVSLFNWSTVHWNKEYRPLYFQEVPSIVSSQNVAHWFQQVATGEFRRFDFGIKMNKKRYGQDCPPKYPLEKIDCPVALCFGTMDKLVNVEKLRKLLPNVVFEKEIEGYYHLDTLNAESAHKLLYPQLLEMINKL